MNPILKWSGVVALVIAIIACFLPAGNGKTVFGNVVDTSYFDYFDATTGFKLGGVTFYSSSGLTLPANTKGTCSLILTNYSLAASTSIAADCAVSGVTSTAFVMAQFATSTGAYAGWLVTGASASTTSGFITLDIVNNTGATAVIPASVASSTKYLILR